LENANDLTSPVLWFSIGNLAVTRGTLRPCPDVKTVGAAKPWTL
jgi:hypothetical protein